MMKAGIYMRCGLEADLDTLDALGGLAEREALVLVNRRHPLAPEAVPAPELLAPVGPGVLLHRAAAAAYRAVIREIGAEGEIIPTSGYRSRAEQARIYEETLHERGEAYANTYVALPGCSEHETGLAIDVAKRGGGMDEIAPSFPYSGICQRFREAALRHGFIQRYPAGKQHITGIGHEPWHFRYVGAAHARAMGGLGLCLEEYWARLKAYPDGGYSAAAWDVNHGR